jgi:hypothetical protein
MARWRHSFYKLVPSWLSSGDGEKVLYTLGRLTDGFVDRARRSLTARFPTYSGPTGLAMLGDERGIVKGRNEGLDGYARRLRGWRGIRGHQVRGNPYAMLYQIWNYFGGMTVREMDAAGNVFTTARDGTESVTHGGSWNWDSDAPVLQTPEHDPDDGDDVPDLLLSPGASDELVLNCDGTPGRLIFLHVGTGAADNTAEPEEIKGRGWNLAAQSTAVTGTGAPYTSRVYWRITGPYESFTSVTVACANTQGAGNVRFIGRAVNVPGTYTIDPVVEAVAVVGNGTSIYSPQLAQDTPFMRSAGASVAANSASLLDVPYPAVTVAGDTFYMHVVGRAGADDPVAPTGWTLVDGPLVTGDGANGRSYLFKRTAVAVGTEAGTTVPLAAFGVAAVLVRMYGFANVAGHELVTTSNSSGSDVIVGPDLAPGGDYRLCVSFVGVVRSGSAAMATTEIQTTSATTVLTGGTWSRAVDDASSSGSNGSLLSGVQVAPEAIGDAIDGGEMTSVVGATSGAIALHALCLIGTATVAPVPYPTTGLLFAQGRLTTYAAVTYGWTELDAERTAGAIGIGIDEQQMVVPSCGQGPGVLTLGATSAVNVIGVRVIPKLPAPWYRFWLKLVPEADQGITAHPTLGAGVWGGSLEPGRGYTLGQTGVTPGDAAVVKNLFRGDHPWKMAGTKAEWLVLVLGEDEAHTPDGTWRAFTYNGVPTRFAGWRYWKL